MKKIVLSTLMLLTATSAFASPGRHCQEFRYRHHHRYCARYSR